MFVSSAKTAEPTEMSFGILTWVGSRNSTGPRNHVLDRGGDPQVEEAIFCKRLYALLVPA